MLLNVNFVAMKVTENNYECSYYICIECQT